MAQDHAPSPLGLLHPLGIKQLQPMGGGGEGETQAGLGAQEGGPFLAGCYLGPSSDSHRCVTQPLWALHVAHLLGLEAFILVVLGMEPRASYRLGGCSAPELYPEFRMSSSL